MLNKVPVQIRQSYEEKVNFPFLADRRGNLVAQERHHYFKIGSRGRSLVVINGPGPRRCVRGIIFT